MGKKATGQLKYHDGYKYQLHETYTVQTCIYPPYDIVTEYISLTKEGLLTLKEGYACDGPSGPTVDTKNFIRGAFGHDGLYQLMRTKLLDCGWRPTVDNELVRWCKEDGMCWIRCWWVLKAVSFGGEKSASWQEEIILTVP